MESRLLLSLVAAPFVFAVCAFATRAPARRIAAALAGGVAFAVGNAGWDLLAHAAGWWSYPGIPGNAVVPWFWYAAAGLSVAGISLIGWRAWRRFGPRGLVAFLGLFALYGMLRDWSVASAAGSIIRFAPGAVPWLMDGTAWLSLMAVVLAIQLALGGEMRTLR